MTREEAIEAGVLAQALKDITELIVDCQGAATGEIDPACTRWKLMYLEIWGRDYEADDNQQRVGDGVALPLLFAPRALKAVEAMILMRLNELGVSVQIEGAEVT